MGIVTKGNWEPSGDIREPKVGEHFINSYGKLERVDTKINEVPFLGKRRMIMVEAGFFDIRLTPQQYRHMLGHNDLVVKNAVQNATAVML